MSNDIVDDTDFWYEHIDKVLLGESELEEIFGNVCYLNITKNKTEVGNNLLERDEITDEDWCEISTLELRGLIGIWMEARQKFYKKGE